ncbi:MAG: hypothetical protein KatS3mg130_1021 [Candidatus Sumerlaea sp.]|nr:MAG: hypothetical protein KatS3mg130_1021 [Candidatus Sumerlaea sp.]
MSAGEEIDPMSFFLAVEIQQSLQVRLTRFKSA